MSHTHFLSGTAFSLARVVTETSGTLLSEMGKPGLILETTSPILAGHSIALFIPSHTLLGLAIRGLRSSSRTYRLAKATQRRVQIKIHAISRSWPEASAILMPYAMKSATKLLFRSLRYGTLAADARSWSLEHITSSGAGKAFKPPGMLLFLTSLSRVGPFLRWTLTGPRDLQPATHKPSRP